MIDIIGYVAALLTTLSFFPQAFKTIKTRDTSGISLLMYSMFVGGVLLWLCYGLLKGDNAIIFANLVTFFLAGAVLIIKIKAVRKIKIK